MDSGDGWIYRRTQANTGNGMVAVMKVPGEDKGGDDWIYRRTQANTGDGMVAVMKAQDAGITAVTAGSTGGPKQIQVI